jgi:hypothetical protein
MITILLTNDWLDFKIRRYETNSFDDAAISLVDDWRDGKIVWDLDELNEGFTPEWLELAGYPTDEFEPEIDNENEVVKYKWHLCAEDESDDLIVYGYFFKTVPVENDEWPRLGIG